MEAVENERGNRVASGVKKEFLRNVAQRACFKCLSLATKRGVSIKPRVERNARNPGFNDRAHQGARETGDRLCAVAHFVGFVTFNHHPPGGLHSRLYSAARYAR